LIQSRRRSGIAVSPRRDARRAPSLGVVVVPGRTALGVVALGSVLAATVFAAPPAAADSTPSPGSITTTIDGVPAKVTVGGSFSPTFTIRSTSADRIEVQDFSFSITSPGADSTPDPADSSGIDVLWKDPATGIWRSSSARPIGGVWALSEPAHAVWIPPHGSLSVRLYITMNGAAARGPAVITTTGICAYSLFTLGGVNVAGELGYNHAHAQFYFGAPSNGTGSSTAPGPSTPDTPGATWQPSSTDAPTSDPTPPLNAGPPPTGIGGNAALIPASVAASPIEDASAHATGFGTYAVPLAAVVLLVFAAFAIGIALTQRGRARR
jgi:hypothetical protein